MVSYYASSFLLMGKESLDLLRFHLASERLLELDSWSKLELVLDVRRTLDQMLEREAYLQPI